MFVILMQDNPNVVLYRNGLPMLHLYQDIFEGQGIIGSFAYHSISIYMRPSGSDDEDDCANETMNTTCFSPSMNRSSRSISKGKSKGRRNRPTRVDQLIDAVRELINRVGFGQGHGVEAVDPAQSSMNPLDKSALIL